MENKIKDLLSEKLDVKMKLMLELLYLKYRKVSKEFSDINRVDFDSYFCFDNSYENEIKDLSEFYNISFDIDNPLNNEVVKRLENENLIEISGFQSRKDGIKLMIPNGIDKLKNLYGVDEEIVLDKTIIVNMVNNVNIHIGDTINNITNGLKDSDKEFFLSILKEYGNTKNKQTFLIKLKGFVGKVGGDVMVNFLVEILNPDNLNKILEGINII